MLRDGQHSGTMSKSSETCGAEERIGRTWGCLALPITLGGAASARFEREETHRVVNWSSQDYHSHVHLLAVSRTSVFCLGHHAALYCKTIGRFTY